MSERRPLVAGNWKMHGTRAEAAALVDGIVRGLRPNAAAEVLVCPPFVLIPLVAEKLGGTKVGWGGQNLDPHASGAYTGEVSGPMLRDLGCTYVIVGHSERRAYYGESDEIVADKFGAAQAAGLTPILCVGETLEERESNRTETVVARQLDAVMGKHGVDGLARAVIAYEPVWAIGTGRTATPDQAQEVHAFIRGRIRSRNAGIGGKIRILYGGSVKGGNAAELFRQPDIDGGLIGGASLKADEFLAICHAA
ncbi:triosephosphate isomerase [Sulfurifustis variabilis]|uniref:Triosephosphate isomerase n=1 Tax=Sulfurifustis variabilis TaxID=1675686 RepID=A0A1B4V604_9GAMM|nr:triose-phosphate isomerase [Sulfurifustis variabilis]BAU48969.1 triosephosphate isomerase [Sulfurifustis variabilis]